MGSTKVQAPSTPAAPTAAQTAQDYATALPIYYQTALQYEPQMAALEKQINEQLYPQTAGLQETIAGQAATGLSQPLPDWYKTQVGETLKSQLGRNLVYNPQGQEQYGVATQQAYQGYGDYWRNLALSAAGRQPLAASPNIMQTYTPAANMTNSAQNYGNYSSAYANMYGTNQKQAQANQENTMGYVKMGSSLLGGMMMSSRRFKKNIRLWKKHSK